MTNGNNLRATICGVAIVPTSSVTMGTSIGQSTVAVTPASAIEFNRVQSASFSERKSESGDYVTQELECIYTDTSQTAELAKQQLTDVDCIVLLKYSNDKVKVIGTDLAPVRVELEESGNPQTIKLSFNRKSPEFAKFLQSLN